MINEIKLEEGMNGVDTPNGAGTMNIMVRDGVITKITMFNAKISKKKTHTCTDGSWVNLEVKTDW